MILRVKKKTKKPQRANNEQLFFSTSNTHSLQIISTKGCGGNSPQGTFPKGFQVHVGGWLYKLQLALSYSLQSNGQYLHPNLCLLWPQFNCCNASKLHHKDVCTETQYLHILPTVPQSCPVNTLRALLYLPAYQSFPWPITKWEVPVLQPRGAKARDNWIR